MQNAYEIIIERLQDVQHDIKHIEGLAEGLRMDGETVNVECLEGQLNELYVQAQLLKDIRFEMSYQL